MKSVMTTFTPPCDDASQQSMDPFSYNLSGADIDEDLDFWLKMFDTDLAAESQAEPACPNQVDVEAVNNNLLTLDDPLLSATSHPVKMMVPIYEDLNGGTGSAESFAELEVIWESNNQNDISIIEEISPDHYINQWSGLGPNLSSASTSQGALIDDLGDVKWEVKNIKRRKSSWLTCYSEKNHLYHVQSGTNGRFNIKIDYKNIVANQNGKYFVRSVLIRSNPEIQHFPVDRVCSKHSAPGAPNQPIQPLPGAVAGSYAFTEATDTAIRPSLIQWCNMPDNEGNISADLDMIFMCNDSCANSSFAETKKENAKEASRDLYLVSTLEIICGDVVSILARSKVPVWIKTSVCKRDLIKEIRRKPKGAAAQIQNMKKRTREETEDKVFPKMIKIEPPVLSATSFEYHLDQLALGIKHGQITEEEILNKLKHKIAQ